LAPERFPEIVCLAPATNPQLAPPGVTKLYWSAKAWEKFLTPFVMKEILKRVSRDPSNHEPESIQRYMQPYLRNPDAIQCFIKAVKVLRDPRLPHAFESVRSPVLLLWGEQDKMVPLRFMQELHKVLPSSQLLITEGGHHLQEDEPEWVLSKIQAFFGSQDF
jgi:pimeloyl-ACP methyl ester carboxylesterase